MQGNNGNNGNNNGTSVTSGVTVVHSPACPNCVRFVEALRRTAAASTARLVDVRALPPHHLAQISLVPCVIVDGATHQGTKAFEWLREIEAAPPESFGGFDDAFTSFDGTADAETLHAASCGYGLF